MIGWTLLVILFLVVGLSLLLIEIFVIPGFGVVGGMGIVTLVAAAAVAWIELGPLEGILAVAASVVGTTALVWALRRSGVGKKLVLEEVQRSNLNDPALIELIGAEGVALTPLRPSGTAKFRGRGVDVVTEGVYVDAGAPVRVIRVEGPRVVVERATQFTGG